MMIPKQRSKRREATRERMRERRGAHVRSNIDESVQADNDDVVDHAFRLVVVMNAHYRHRPVAASFRWLPVIPPYSRGVSLGPLPLRRAPHRCCGGPLRHLLLKQPDQLGGLILAQQTPDR